jgi:hypothetical protein
MNRTLNHLIHTISRAPPPGQPPVVTYAQQPLFCCLCIFNLVLIWCIGDLLKRQQRRLQATTSPPGVVKLTALISLKTGTSRLDGYVVLFLLLSLLLPVHLAFIWSFGFILVFCVLCIPEAYANFLCALHCHISSTSFLLPFLFLLPLHPSLPYLTLPYLVSLDLTMCVDLDL